VINQYSDIKDCIDNLFLSYKRFDQKRPSVSQLNEFRNEVLDFLKAVVTFYGQSKELGPWEKSCLLSALDAFRKNMEGGDSTQWLTECLTHLKELTVDVHARTEHGLPLIELKQINQQVFEGVIQDLADQVGSSSK
jgi:hypothetical protein